ncbi:uncharacterized protein LOC124303830 isoform X1 [Neodiprion virginianus]|uniref:uncharacterized protein LOC124303830 isoform X1 n=2 Tax=Neodiprion virginianus TaxID=2961670 RepID=UPI001EE74882|nr:uncharacterized protein LOC124303830 isoform X1 [Neodiprion virginianus]
MDEMQTALPVKELHNLLQETLGPKMTIKSVVWKPLTNPGENYGSLIYGIDATIARNNTTEVLNLVVKIPPPTEYLIDLFNSPISFWKELIFYKKIVPEFTKLQMESGIDPDKLVKFPLYYGGRLGLTDPNVFDEQAAIVLQNLIPKGYSVRDRLLGLDLEHTQLAIEELAKLHAVTIGLKLKDSEFFKHSVMPALVHVANDTTMETVRDMLRQVHDTLKELPEAKPYINRINKTLRYDYEIDYRLSKPSEPWGTMVHGDYWSNNMLFKYAENSHPISIKIIDFQLGYYGSGAKDLIFFLLSSVQDELLNNSLEDMLDYYYKSFINSLTSLKVDTEKFTREGFDEEVKKSAPLKFGQCIGMTNVIHSVRGVVKNMEDVGKDVNFSAIGNNIRVQKKLLHILQIFDKNQWLID